MRITQKMSQQWLEHLDKMSPTKKDEILEWLYKKKFFKMGDVDMVAFFARIPAEKFPDHKAFTWYILYANEIIDRVMEKRGK